MKKYLLPLILALLTSLFTSCIVIIDDDGKYSSQKGTVQIQNCDPDREAYIKSVEYWNDFLNQWVECWNYTEENTDSYISFKLSPDYYIFKITVIYPLYDGYRDFYDTFETDYPIDVDEYKITDLRFDGKRLYEI